MTVPSVNRLEIPVVKADRANDVSALGQRVDLVEHVQVELTVRLGTAELAIGELFALAPGAVLELDRDIDAPVDLELHGRVVARGHLVAVGDRYGVRVTEVCVDSP